MTFLQQMPCRSRMRFFAPLLTLLGAAHCNSNPPPNAPPDASHSTPIAPPQGTPSSAVTPSPVPSPSASPEATRRLANSSNAFGFDLYQRLRSEKGNLAVSPASITTALAMTWGGAQGETAEQMRKVLHLEGTPSDVMQASGKLASSLQDPNRPIKFRIANRLFGEKSYKFESPFLEATKAAYGAPLEAVDFITGYEPARVHINGWVEAQTEKRIRDLIPPSGLGSDTRLVLVNAIYFLGDWQLPFAKEATRPAPFSPTAAATKSVPTMNSEEHFRFVEKDGMKALEMGYKGGAMSMLFVLPDKADGLEAVEKSLDAAKLDGIVASLASQKVNVALPKFEINPAASLSLGDRLQQMGMPLAFTPRADFTGIANPPSAADRLYISRVFHKAFVRVDEKGTEAAAATAVVMARAGAAMHMPEKVATFHADHPFLFFIRDNATGTILFNGRVSDPAAT